MQENTVMTPWNVETLREYADIRIADLNRKVNDLEKLLDSNVSSLEKLLDERYATQTKANDTAFNAASTAMSTAMTAAALAVQTALQAAKEAVAKAETAADKRFDALSTQLAQLTSQASSLISRYEVDTLIKAVSAKADYEADRAAERVRDLDKNTSSEFVRVTKAINDLSARLSARLDIKSGEDTGSALSNTNKRLNATLILFVISVGLTVYHIVTGG